MKKFANFFRGDENSIDYDELEALLLQSDMGVTLTQVLLDTVKKQHVGEAAMAKQLLIELIMQRVRREDIFSDVDGLWVYLFVGVNGTGKTTTLAKFAHYLRHHQAISDIAIAAGDTYRAAAIEQLAQHAENIPARLISQQTGADPSAVIFDALQSAHARADQVLLADTSGRMQTRSDLMGELQKIDRVIKKQQPVSRYRKLLVIDATTGWNAIDQAKIFHDAIGIDAVICSKYDAASKGGILIPLWEETGIGCALLGTGERLDSLEVFQPLTYAQSLVDLL